MDQSIACRRGNVVKIPRMSPEPRACRRTLEQRKSLEVGELSSSERMASRSSCHSTRHGNSVCSSEIVSVPVRAFSQANEAQFYVSMSRARSAMHVFTDSKVALREAVTRPSKRLSSWELLNFAAQDRTLKAELARQRSEPKKQQQEIAYER